MSDSWLDRIPSRERQRLREKFRLSEAEYEKLREKVKGPEAMEREMRRNELLAELRFAMETEPKVAEALKAQVQEDVQREGLESVLRIEKVPAGLAVSLEKGLFALSVEADKKTNEDQLVVVPEGNIALALPLTLRFSNQYLGQFKRAA
ncbi:MAG: hypothetical protein PHI23_02820 [Candidatus Peribacteraceae bacterium]|nr:hypothetical protein [Candidatus Peribacteraceae bacterium]